MKKQPFVSIIMPVYNGSRFVEKAINSILRQTYLHFEFIIVDDGSTDGTLNILRNYRKQFPKKIRIYRHVHNLGESVAASLAYSKTRGTYVARMDADDVAHPKRIEKQVAYMEHHPRVIALGTQAHVINASGRHLGEKHVPLEHERIMKAFAFYNAMIHPSLMLRKNLLPSLTQLYKSTFESTDDYHTYFDLMKHGLFANLPEKLVSYRIHGANKSLVNMKEKFWTDTKVRLEATTKHGYHAPLLMFPIIVMQAFLVIVLPENLLRELFYYLRGIKRIEIPRFHMKNHRKLDTIKWYALNLR